MTTALAVDAVETLAVSRGEIERIRPGTPQIEELLRNFFVSRSAIMFELVLELMHVPTERRVLKRLVALTYMYQPESRRTPEAIAVPVTQDLLASMAGTTRATTNRVLQAARHQGLVSLARSRITVLDLTGLERAAR